MSHETIDSVNDRIIHVLHFLRFSLIFLPQDEQAIF